jgi:hypothetical protein
MYYICTLFWIIKRSYAVAQMVEALRYKPKGRGIVPDGVIGICHWHNPSGRNMALEVDSASNRNENQGYLLGVKAASA